jgi:ribosomal protein S12 methylthiotransferase
MDAITGVRSVPFRSSKGTSGASVPSEIVREIRELVNAGTKEVILVAQGHDPLRRRPWVLRNGLPDLLRSIAEHVPELPWLRLLYLYPSPTPLSTHRHHG